MRCVCVCVLFFAGQSPGESSRRDAVNCTTNWQKEMLSAQAGLRICSWIAPGWVVNSNASNQFNPIQFRSHQPISTTIWEFFQLYFLQVELPALSRFLVKVSPGTLAASTACAVQPSVWCRSVDAWAPWPLKQLPWRQDVFRSSNCGFTSFSWHLFTIFYPLAFWAWLCCF